MDTVEFETHILELQEVDNSLSKHNNFSYIISNLVGEH
jgi:hypothetical protein